MGGGQPPKSARELLPSQRAGGTLPPRGWLERRDTMYLFCTRGYEGGSRDSLGIIFFTDSIGRYIFSFLVPFEVTLRMKPRSGLFGRIGQFNMGGHQEDPDSLSPSSVFPTTKGTKGGGFSPAAFLNLVSPLRLPFDKRILLPVDEWARNKQFFFLQAEAGAPL